jgi:uroporphyrinogen decarboxylase
MTTKKERLEAAIRGEIADRPPVALWRHFPVDDQDPLSLARSAAAFQRRFDFDFVKVTPSSSFCLYDWGARDEWRGADEGTREYTQRVVSGEDEWEKLPRLDPTRGHLGRQLQCLTALREDLGDDVPIIQTIFNPLSQAKNLAGKERMMVHLRRSPDRVHRGLEIITETTVEFLESAKKTGIDGIFFATQHASFHYFDKAGYEQFGQKYDLRILEQLDDLWLNVLHLHGGEIMFDLATHYPTNVVNWHDQETPPDLATAQGLVSGAVCGGLQRESLVLDDPGTIGRDARKAIESTGGRGFILGTGCVVPIKAPRENIQAVRSAVDFA